MEAGVSAKAFPAEGKDHGSINADLGKPDDEATKALFEFLAAAPLAGADAAGKKDAIPTEAITASIAIPVHHGHRFLNDGDHFHVLLKNVSEKPVRLWTDRFSWGYDNLTFEQLHEDGKTTRIVKKHREWSKNYPDWLELQPGESYVLNVNLFSGIWENTPGADPQAKPKLVKLRAVYEVREEEESEKLGVWAGKITSTTGTYAIW